MALSGELLYLQPADVMERAFFCISEPLDPAPGLALARQLPGLPLLVIDCRGRLVAGHDLFGHLPLPALRLDLDEVDGLWFNYQFKCRLGGCNPLERLLFLQKIVPLVSREELQRRTGAELPLAPEVLDHLAGLLAADLRPLLAAASITIKTAVRLLDFSVIERAPLLALLAAHPYGDNQQLKVIDLVQESAFRDKITPGQVLERAGVPALLATEMPQKRIIAALQAWRWPAVEAHTRQWQERLASLRLPPHIRVSHAPFFEKRQVEVGLTFGDTDQAIAWLTALADEGRKQG